MPEPSLGELASAGQSQEAVPNVAVNNQQEMVRTLNQQAQFKAENDWRKYQSFLKERSDTLQNLAEIQKMSVMNEDKPELQQDAVAMYRQILNNPGAFIGKDPDKYTEIQSMYGGLLSKATQSKQDNDFDKSNRAYIAQNNELNTDENKAIIESNRAQPLGSRKPYTLNLPSVLDIDAYTKGIMDSPSVKTDFATSEVTPDNQFIIERNGTKYNRDNFIKNWMGGLDVKTDKYGHSVSTYVKGQYDKLSDENKAQLPGKTDEEKARNFWKMQGERVFGSDKDIESDKKENRTGNPGYKKADELDLKKSEADEKVRHDKAMESLGWSKFNFDSQDDKDAASGVVTEVGDIIGNALRPENLQAVVDPNGHRQQWGPISDPELIKKYTTIDKDGKTTHPPDAALIDPTSNQINLVYYKKNKKTGQPEKNRIAGKDYDVIEKTVPISATTWVSQVVGRNENAKDKGMINKNVQDFFKKNGGVYQSIKKMRSAEQGQQTQGQQKATELDPNGFKKEGDNYRYKDGTLFDENGNIVKEK